MEDLLKALVKCISMSENEIIGAKIHQFHINGKVLMCDVTKSTAYSETATIKQYHQQTA